VSRRRIAIACALTVANATHAAEPCPRANVEAIRTPAPSPYVLCPERCSQSEACVAGRCVLSCDIECREGTYCSSLGTCVPIPRPITPSRTEADLHEQLGPRSKQHRSAVWLDIAGILLDGAQVSYEWGDTRTWVLGVRPLSTGFWNYASVPANALEMFDYGASLSVVRRVYEKRFGNMRGMYYGLGMEAFGVHVVDLTNGVERVSFGVTPLGQFGYRWAWNSFVFGFGPVLGLRVPVYSYRYGPGLSTCPAEACAGTGDVALRGLLSVEVGFFP
jgi:hypothetical protein